MLGDYAVADEKDKNTPSLCRFLAKRWIIPEKQENEETGKTLKKPRLCREKL